MTSWRMLLSLLSYNAGLCGFAKSFGFSIFLLLGYVVAECLDLETRPPSSLEVDRIVIRINVTYRELVRR